MKIGYTKPVMTSHEMMSSAQMLSASAISATSKEINDTIRDWRTFGEDMW